MIAGIIDGADSYENLKPFFSSIERHRRCSITTSGMKEDWSVAGDMLASSQILGLGGRFHVAGFNCLHCKVHSSHLHKTESCTRRYRRELWWCAHMPDPQMPPESQFPFICPGCEMVFQSQEEVDNEVPPKNEQSYLNQHWSTSHHRPPLLDVEPEKVYICSLHLLLSITKKLFHCSVRLNIHTSEHAKSISALLSSHNMSWETGTWLIFINVLLVYSFVAVYIR